ncbi:MAG: methyltransferase domain-containing protein [Syntrophomonadaceae bacterium]|nr:methyltransferase domain-containing protein [Syntrophomonadaceae bacterium]
MEKDMTNVEVHTKELWDARSAKWATRDAEDQKARQQNEARYQYTDDFLRNHNLYDSNSEILDIGCGLGMFTVRFAQKGKRVTGLDISGKMLEYARQNVELNGLENVDFIDMPWQDIDLRQSGLEKAFDLVFASLCPGISSDGGLMKMSQASRDWCFTCHFARRFSSLKNDVYLNILGRPYDSEWGKNSIGKSIDELLKAGYYPNLSYYDSNVVVEWPLDEDTAMHFAGHLGPLKEEREYIDRYTGQVFDYLKTVAVNGLIRDDTEAKIAFLYWQAT